MAINPNISLAVRGIELQDPLAQYGKVVAIQNAQQQNQLAQLQMREAQATAEERNALRQLDPTSADYVNQLSRYDPKLALEFRKEQTAADTARLTREKTQFEVQNLKRNFIAQAQRDTSQNPSDANITAYKEDLAANPLFTDAEKERLFAGVDRILATPVEQRKAFMASQGASASELKPNIQQVNQGGQTQVLRVPAYAGAPTAIGTYADVAAPPEVVQQKAAVARAGAPIVSVSTEKKYGEAFGGKMAEADIGKLTAAEKAPQLADSANRIIDLVAQGNIFTGPAADIKLNIARALNVAGADNQEKIANTESLIAASGQSTLDAIKSAGLGTGQGFTDKDLKFLQGIAGGTINLTSQTLTELAKLQHRAATRTAESWNKRVQEMPREVLQGTGLSTAPIKVPELKSGARGPSVGAVQDGYRFKGGNPADAKNWEKL